MFGRRPDESMCIDVKVRVGTLLLVLDGKTRGFFLSGMTLPESLRGSPETRLGRTQQSAQLQHEERRQSEIHGVSASASNSNPQSAYRARETIPSKCTFCRKLYHTEATCYRKNGYPVGHLRSGQVSAQAASTSVQASYTTALNYSAVSACCLSSAAASSSSTSTLDWLIDSGASTHICAQRSSFSSLRQLEQRIHINIADGRAIRALGIGDISLDVLCGTEWISNIFKDVLFAPDLKMNLLSVSRLTNDGLIVSFFDDHCHIKMQDRMVASSIKEASDLSIGFTNPSINASCIGRGFFGQC